MRLGGGVVGSEDDLFACFSGFYIAAALAVMQSLSLVLRYG
jgi:hypothetical protein